MQTDYTAAVIFKYITLYIIRWRKLSILKPSSHHTDIYTVSRITVEFDLYRSYLHFVTCSVLNIIRNTARCGVNLRWGFPAHVLSPRSCNKWTTWKVWARQTPFFHIIDYMTVNYDIYYESLKGKILFVYSNNSLIFKRVVCCAKLNFNILRSYAD